MGRSTRSVVVALVCALVVVGLGGAPADAKAKKGKKKIARVTMITRAGQDWNNGRLKVRWRAVRGVSYHMRYAASPSALASTRPVWVGTSRGAYTRSLDRGKTWFFQVRGVRKGVVGPWSRIRPLRFLQRWPGKPASVTASGLPGAVQFNWSAAANTTRYRVRWSPAWYGAWPGPVTYTTEDGAWLGSTARSSTYTVPERPQVGDGMLAVPYANPVFGRIESNNSYVRSQTATSLSSWAVAWPKAPAPADGAPVRFGTYNVMLNPTGSRATAVARNISSHGLTMVALQESSDKSVNAIIAALGSSWRAVPTSSNTQQIIFRTDKFTQLSAGSINIDNPRAPSTPVITPWARFAPVGGGQTFYVVSAHFTEDASKTAKQKNADTGKAARQVMSAMGSVNYGNEPQIVAGDLRYGLEPWGDEAGYVPAQPTFVRGGYYDAMASQAKTGHTYSTVNSSGGSPTARQVPNAAGLGPRADYILMKGITGSKTYTNVYNWTYNGTVPTDHNLVYSDILVPTQ